jgi:hypothetical protein
LDLNLNDVINFSATDEKKILKIHTPKNVTIEYYITAKNSINYNNLGKTKETLNLEYPNDFYSGIAKTFGIFTSKPLKELEILGFGEKILSEDITDLWNEATCKRANAHSSTFGFCRHAKPKQKTKRA